MNVVRDDLWLCDDCLFAAINGDLPISTERGAEIAAGLTELGHLVPDFDAEAVDGIEEISGRSCDCCKTHLAGGRHRFAILG